MMRIPEHLRTYAKLARKQKWRIYPTSGGHIRWESPSGQHTISGATPSNTQRERANMKIRLRRMGLKIE